MNPRGFDSFLFHVWLGLQDSNLRMTGPKPVALPLGEGPISLYLSTAPAPCRCYTKSMTQYIWHNEAIPSDLRINQVHAVLVTDDGRILLRIKNNSYRLTGGHPEPEDQNADATIHREALEEADVEVDKIDYIGYQEVFDDDGNHYAQMRVVARVSKINPATPDPDRRGRWIYGRALVTPDSAREQLPFGELNQPLIDNAIKVAQQNRYFTKPINTAYELINREDKQSPDAS